MSPSHQGSLCISECGRISPLPEHESASCLHPVAFSEDPQNYEEFLQARNLVWDFAMRSPSSELLPEPFAISPKLSQLSEAELGRIGSTLRLYFNSRVEVEVADTSMLSPIRGLNLLQADTPSKESPGLDPTMFSATVVDFFSAVFHSRPGISPASTNPTLPADSSREPNSPVSSLLSTTSLVSPDILDNSSPTDRLSADRLLQENDAAKAVELFSYEEINREGPGFIPALVLREGEVIGDRILNPKTGGYFYYDPNVLSLHHFIEERSVDELPERRLNASESYLENHAIRLFVEILSFAGGHPTPAYKYIGDFYLKRTGGWLDGRDWAACRAETKETVIARFMDSNKARHYSRQVNSPSEVFAAYDQGRMFPRVLLHPTYGEASSTGYEGCLPLSLFNTQEAADSFAMLYATPHLSRRDSISVYSQESAPRSLLDSPPHISSHRLSQELHCRSSSLSIGELDEEPYSLQASTLVESRDNMTKNKIEEETHLSVLPGSVEKLPSLSCASKDDLFSDYSIQISPQKSGRITRRLSSMFKIIRVRGIPEDIPPCASMNSAPFTTSWKRRVFGFSGSPGIASDADFSN